MEARPAASELHPPHRRGLLLCRKIGRTLFRRQNNGVLGDGRGVAFTEYWLCSECKGTGDFTKQSRGRWYRRIWHGPAQELCSPWLHPRGLDPHLALKEMAFGVSGPMNSATWVFVLILSGVCS